jgi:hypothetical protein
MNTLLNRVKHEVLELIPPAVFFFIAFQVIAFTRALMLEQYGIKVTTFVAATIGALVVAKVILIADMLPFINRYPGKPLIYNVVWKTAIYFVVSLLVRYVEHIIPFVRKQGSLIAANRQLMDEVIWPHFWAIQIWLLLLLLVYCSFRELVRALGRDRVLQMFFGHSGQNAA